MKKVLIGQLVLIFLLMPVIGFAGGVKEAKAGKAAKKETEK